MRTTFFISSLLLIFSFLVGCSTGGRAKGLVYKNLTIENGHLPNEIDTLNQTFVIVYGSEFASETVNYGKRTRLEYMKEELSSSRFPYPYIFVQSDSDIPLEDKNSRYRIYFSRRGYTSTFGMYYLKLEDKQLNIKYEQIGDAAFAEGAVLSYFTRITEIARKEYKSKK